MALPASLLEVSHVTVRRGERAVVTEVSLSVRGGTLTALVGPNGAGKSSLLQALAGVLPHAGTVTLDGRALAGMEPRHRARHVASTGQAEVPEEELAALEVVLLGRAPHLGSWGLPSDEDVARARAALEELDALHLADRRVGTLSGGEVQRVVVARALCTAADVLLLDEPTSALDLGQAHALMRVLRRRAEAGCAVVVVMHDLAMAARHADHLVVLRDGSVLAQGAPAEVLVPATLQAGFGVQARVVMVDGNPLVSVVD